MAGIVELELVLRHLDTTPISPEEEPPTKSPTKRRPSSEKRKK